MTDLDNVPAVVEGGKEGVGTLQPEAGVHVTVQQQEQLVQPVATTAAVKNHLKCKKAN